MTLRSVGLMKPYRFRFTEEADVKAYGAGWYVYDEAQIVRLPVRHLAKLEAELGQTIAAAIDGFRQDTVMGRLACTWLAVHMHDPNIAGAFASYEPVVLLLDLEEVPDGELPPESTEAAVGPLDPTTTESSPTGQPPES